MRRFKRKSYEKERANKFFFMSQVSEIQKERKCQCLTKTFSLNEHKMPNRNFTGEF